MDVRRKYSGLRFLALLIKIVAWLVLIGSVAAAIWFWMQGDAVPGPLVGDNNWSGLILLPLGIYGFLQLYIIGSLISLFIDIEYNTRANATAGAHMIALLEKMGKKADKGTAPVIATPPPPPPPPLPQEPSRPATPPEKPKTSPPKTKPVKPVESAPPPPPPPAPDPIPSPPPAPTPADKE
jgi:hypothetical protein